MIESESIVDDHWMINAGKYLAAEFASYIEELTRVDRRVSIYRV